MEGESQGGKSRGRERESVGEFRVEEMTEETTGRKKRWRGGGGRSGK